MLPLALFASALWQTSREPEKPLEAPDMSDNSLQTARRKPASATEPPAGFAAAKIDRVLFVPDDNGDLKKVVVKDDYPGPTTAWPDYYGKMSAHLVNNLLFAKFPQDFPPGSKVVEPARVEGDVVTINFNKEFPRPEFWQGETKTLAAIYSIVNTVVALGSEAKQQTATPPGAKPGAAGGTGGEYKVRFLIEGKPIQTLGEFDTGEPLESDPGMVAPH